MAPLLRASACPTAACRRSSSETAADASADRWPKAATLRRTLGAEDSVVCDSGGVVVALPAFAADALRWANAALRRCRGAAVPLAYEVPSAGTVT